MWKKKCPKEGHPEIVPPEEVTAFDDGIVAISEDFLPSRRGNRFRILVAKMELFEANSLS